MSFNVVAFFVWILLKSKLVLFVVFVFFFNHRSTMMYNQILDIAAVEVTLLDD